MVTEQNITDTVKPVQKKIEVTKRLTSFSPTEELKALAIREKLPTGGLWAYCTVEIADTSGDVVKVAGISWEDYHNPPNCYLKITAQHAMDLADGTPPVIGRVERFVRMTIDIDGVATPALAFYMTWSQNLDGSYDPLTTLYKNKYDAGYMESFSVGLIVTDYEENQTGGLNYNSSMLYHIAAVTVPGNSKATVLRALELEDNIVKLKKALDEQNKLITKQSEMIAELITKSEVQKQIELVSERLDFIEARVVTKSEVLNPLTGDRKRVDSELSEISQLFKRFSGRN